MTTKNNFVASCFQSRELLRYASKQVCLKQCDVFEGIFKGTPFITVIDKYHDLRCFTKGIYLGRILEYKSVKELEEENTLPF